MSEESYKAIPTFGAKAAQWATFNVNKTQECT